MPLAVKINVALREEICQKIGSERVKLIIVITFITETENLYCNILLTALHVNSKSVKLDKLIKRLSNLNMYVYGNL